MHAMGKLNLRVCVLRAKLSAPTRPQTDIYMDWAQAKAGGDVNPQLPFNYFCYGAALSEVEIDCLTGDMQLRRTDLCTVAFACQ